MFSCRGVQGKQEGIQNMHGAEHGSFSWSSAPLLCPPNYYSLYCEVRQEFSLHLFPHRFVGPVKNLPDRWELRQC